MSPCSFGKGSVPPSSGPVIGRTPAGVPSALTGLEPVPTGVDALDLEILQALFWKGTDPAHASRGILKPWDIAEKVGVHGNTVKNRLDALRDEGVLKGVHLIPHDSEQIGLRSGLYRFRFETADGKREGIKAVEDLDGVFDLYEFVGTEAWVGVKVDRPKRLEDGAEELARISGASEVELFYRRDYVEPDRDLSELDLRILRALVPDAQKPFTEVAEEVGVTPRTVRKHFHRMVDDNTVFVYPHLDLGAMQGRVPYGLALDLDPDKADQVQKRVADGFPHAVNRSGSARESAYVLLAGETPGQAEDDRSRFRSLDGVRSANMGFLRRSAMNVEGLRHRLEAMVEETR